MGNRLGILGGGQLCLYLCQAARALDVETVIVTVTGDSNAPAVGAADRVVLGGLDDPQAVQQLIDACDVITYELEAIPDPTLDALRNAGRQRQVVTLPDTRTFAMLKDKGRQKTWLQEQGFPTAKFTLIPGAAADASALVEDLGANLVQKVRSGGYDGMGVQILHAVDPGQLQDALWDTPSVVEQFLSNCREIAVLVVRGANGEMAVYPPMDMAFDHDLNALSMVTSPAKLESAHADAAQVLGCEVVERLNGAGVFALEMFINREGRLWINEISPRVHNSGHLTMEAFSASQFEQHVRAVMGMPLAPIEAVSPAAMVNILYNERLRNSCPPAPVSIPQGDSPVIVHWYGKPPGRQGRKMGHITALGIDARSAAESANRVLLELPSQVAA